MGGGGSNSSATNATSMYSYVDFCNETRARDAVALYALTVLCYAMSRPLF